MIKSKNYKPKNNSPSRRKRFLAVLVLVVVFAVISINHAFAIEFKSTTWTAKPVSVPDNQTPQTFQTSDGKTLQGLSAYYNNPTENYYNTPYQSVLFAKDTNTWYIKDGNTYKNASTLSRITGPTGGDLIKTTATTGFDPLTGQTYINNQTLVPDDTGNTTLQNNWQAVDQSTYTQQKNLQNKQDANSCDTFDVFCYLRSFTIWIANGILWIFSWFVWLGAQLLDISVNLPQLMGGFTKSPVVAIGWPIVCGLANMFFSLVLLVIAFATILRIETYGMKQVLWKLVVAALLINFSLVIAGVIIDGSNVLTNFFIRGNFVQKDTNQPADISAAIYNGLKLQNFYDTDITMAAKEGTGISGGGAQAGGQLKILLNIILGVIFMLVTAFVLFAAAILFFIRMVALWILLIFAPMAWLAMILPGTRNLWNKWWSEFMKWIIFAPVYAFFIYLTVAIINNDILKKTLEQGNKAYQGDGFIITKFLGSNLGFVANYVVLIIFMVAGLIFARQSGIAGATAMANLGKSWRSAGGRVMSRWAARGAKVPGATLLANKLGITAGLNKMMEKGGWQKAVATALRAPGAAKRFAAPFASPQVWTRYFAASRQRADNASFGEAGGKMQDFFAGFGRLVKGGGTKFDEEQAEKEQIQALAEQKMREKGFAPKDAPENIRNAAMQEAEKEYNDEQEKLKRQQIDAMARQNYDDRITGTKPGYTAGEQDAIIRKQGAQPHTPEAERIMQEWDRQQAEKQYTDWQTSGKGIGALAVRRETLKDMFTGTGLYAKLEKQKIVQQRQTEFAQAFKDEDQAVNYFKMTKDPVEREALFRLIASINGLNTLFGTFGKTFTPGNLKSYLKTSFPKGDAERIAADVSAMAAANGNFSLVGTTNWDQKTNKIRFSNDAEQFNIMLRKIREMEPQQFARQAHPDTFFINRMGKWDMGFHEYGERLLKALDKTFANQMGQRAQGRMHLSININDSIVQAANPEFYGIYTEKRSSK